MVGPGGVPVTVGTDPVGCCASTGIAPGWITPSIVIQMIAMIQITLLVLRNIFTSLSQNKRCGQTKRSNHDQNQDENSCSARRTGFGGIRKFRDFQWRRRGKSWHTS